METICKKCGYSYDNQSNMYGKICVCCGSFIEPEEIPHFVAKNSEIDNSYKNKAINKVKEKLLKIWRNKDDNKI